MAENALSGLLISEFNHVPSGRMVIRRYQDLEERYIKNYFEKGLYCNHLTRFDDDNEGLLGNPGYSNALRGALVAAGGRRRKREDVEKVSDEEFEESLHDFHEKARHKHFANCWRLGMDEPDEMWEEYIEDEELKEGIAFETTIQQFIRAIPTEPALRSPKTSSVKDLRETPMWNIHVGGKSSDIKIGAVRYQDREATETVQPAAYQGAINFFKGKSYDFEREFRLLINPFDSSRLLLGSPDGTLQGEKPDVSVKHRFLPMATTWMTNRIVLAPEATETQREKLERILDDIGVTYGSNGESDLEIVPSSQNLPSRSETHDYDAVFAGQDNYQKTIDYINEEHRKILEQSQEEDWPVTDLVLLQMEKGGAVAEGFRYPSENPEFPLEAYGHDEFQGVVAIRNGTLSKYPTEYKNERMEKFEE